MHDLVSHSALGSGDMYAAWYSGVLALVVAVGRRCRLAIWLCVESVRPYVRLRAPLT